MKEISVQFGKGNWMNSDKATQRVPEELQNLALAFVELQEKRHLADYDNHRSWHTVQVRAVIDTTQKAFRNWLAIRTHPLAGNYLLAMLLGKQR